MNHLIFIQLLAAGEYGCDAYGASAYGECSASTSTTTNPSGGLADTGYDILVPLALGLSIVIASIILLVKTLRRRRSHSWAAIETIEASQTELRILQDAFALCNILE